MSDPDQLSPLVETAPEYRPLAVEEGRFPKDVFAARSREILEYAKDDDASFLQYLRAVDKMFPSGTRQTSWFFNLLYEQKTGKGLNRPYSSEEIVQQSNEVSSEVKQEILEKMNRGTLEPVASLFQIRYEGDPPVPLAVILSWPETVDALCAAREKCFSRAQRNMPSVISAAEKSSDLNIFLGEYGVSLPPVPESIKQSVIQVLVSEFQTYQAYLGTDKEAAHAKYLAQYKDHIASFGILNENEIWALPEITSWKEAITTAREQNTGWGSSVTLDAGETYVEIRQVTPATTGAFRARFFEMIDGQASQEQVTTEDFYRIVHASAQLLRRGTSDFNTCYRAYRDPSSVKPAPERTPPPEKSLDERMRSAINDFQLALATGQIKDNPNVYFWHTHASTLRSSFGLPEQATISDIVAHPKFFEYVIDCLVYEFHRRQSSPEEGIKFSMKFFTGIHNEELLGKLDKESIAHNTKVIQAAEEWLSAVAQTQYSHCVDEWRKALAQYIPALEPLKRASAVPVTAGFVRSNSFFSVVTNKIAHFFRRI